MLNVSTSTAANQAVIMLRLTSRDASACQYSRALKDRGLHLIECANLDAARNAVGDGCRVGLLLVPRDADPSQLDTFEPIIGINQVAWVGLVAQELIATPRMREFIGAHLFNFITIPAQFDHILLTLRHAWGVSFMRDSQERQGPATQADDEGLAMIGDSDQMQRLFGQIQRVARTDASVLIAGPSGTGKELAALSIHRRSARSNAPFVAVNCGAIPPQHLQAELLGYEQGAFTGAAQRKIGLFEAAQGGTLFLDEIGDMPFDMQAALLRFLQQKTIERVGGTEPTAIDMRVIAATNVDLEDAVKQGRFRQDLYYRIDVVCLKMPPLVDRGQDIEKLARFYFTKFAGMHNRSLRGFSKAAMHALLAHDWPGNVRELVNRVQRATVMAEGRFIQPEDLGLDRYTEPARVMSLDEARAVAESEVIRRALSQSRNQISRAAALLGVSRVTLYRLIDKYKIRTDGSPSASPALPSAEWNSESVNGEEDDVPANNDGERLSQID